MTDTTNETTKRFPLHFYADEEEQKNRSLRSGGTPKKKISMTPNTGEKYEVWTYSKPHARLTRWVRETSDILSTTTETIA